MPDDDTNFCSNCHRPCAMYLCGRCSGGATHEARDRDDVPPARRSPQTTRPVPDGLPIHHGAPRRRGA